MNQSDASASANDRIETILSYHQQTKHHLHRYARGPGGLDWANQPNPFRSFEGAAKIDLPLIADALATPFDDQYVPGAARRRQVSLETVAVLFELSLGLSAWKEYRGERWALRCNPSSGNLHPTEGYAILPDLPELPAGVYHYDSYHHRLERRCTQTTGLGLPADCFLVSLSSIHWREAWKYGERAYRYCQHDLGHALAAIRYAAAALGWSARLLESLGDAEVSQLLGLDRTADFAAVDALDGESPGALVLVGPAPLPPEPNLDSVIRSDWVGMANALSRHHVQWDWIDRASEATHKPTTKPADEFAGFALPPIAPAQGSRHPIRAATLIRQRRSALAYDGQTAMEAASLYRMLDRLLPRPGAAPWDLLNWRPHVHVALFAHRIRGLTPGLYLLERDASIHEALRSSCHSQFRWLRPPGCPEHLPFYLLHEQDLRATARTVSCHQDIAADGTFSLGMVVEFADGIRQRGAWWYRRLFWEAGVVGQVLYLEAEAMGLRGTGIGCYFDDAMHQLLGLREERFQVLYHFAVGTPVEDHRLRTLAPYAHRKGADEGTP